MFSSIVETVQGRVRLRPVETRIGWVLRARGIPVARADKRFLPAVAAPAWTGIRDDHRSPSVAPQHLRAFEFAEPGPPVGDERSCVHASVWIPQGAKGLPILVWLHGGGGFAGSSTDRDAAQLASSLGVVVVALSFRLGALGHLHVRDLLGDEYIDSGNVGVSDVQAGLDWVSRNAERLGGDPERIALAGQSAGAAMVATVLSTAAGAGLISRAIMQSGTAERVHDVAQAQGITESLAAEFGDSSRLLESSDADIVRAQGAVLRRAVDQAVILPTPFRPVVGVPSLISSGPHSLGTGAASSIPLLIGTNLRETAGVSRPRASATIVRDDRRHSYSRAMEAVRSAGFDLGDGVTSWCTDLAYRQPTERVLEARRDISSPTYAYLFTGSPGVQPVHNAELDLLFEEPGADSGLSMRHLWRAFLHGGEESLGGFWPPYEFDRSVAILGSESRIEQDPLAPLRVAWGE